MSTEACQKGASVQDPSSNIMAPWTFSVKFPSSTQFTFGSLTFAVGKDENLKLLTQGPASECLAPVYGQAPYLSAISSTSGGACSDLNPYAGPYHPSARIVQGIPIGASILQPSTGASSSLLAASPDQDSADNYPEIGGSTC
jgi:hypothetical protein